MEHLAENFNQKQEERAVVPVFSVGLSLCVRVRVHSPQRHKGTEFDHG